MASTKSAMTPEAAAAAIAEVGEYRQGLTARAAGTLWLVWGLVMAGLGALDFVAIEQMVGMTSDDVQEGIQLVPRALNSLLIFLSLVVVGVLASNAVWRAHAISRDEEHKAWITWGVAGGVTVAFMVSGLITLQVLSNTWQPSGGAGPGSVDWSVVFIAPIFSASAALALTLALRRRVSIVPGAIVTGVLVLFEILVPYVTSGSLVDKVYQAATIHIVLVCVSFSAVGLLLFRRG